ncbi:CPBP family intramembrane metalloprotease domain-containing protein [Bacteroides clarus]|jgi:membrane protease YdiL (CAAX protease family)|uniref:CPBP family intramembrane metalloprotease domain-containing protein n=1 Tax=Bacteroides clarus TaxID=626929 RepID=A0A1Y4JT52_9BACE|nr:MULTISPECIES: type II CAAX endopeptidase family protein [Bacteroides]OKY97778.1 MAG: CAAX protease family protein [Bacteroides sp. 44_46]OUP33281.1 CPBP family intramembrane metalloprotease domain-containing protein [Bacteroides clarus]
METIGNEPKAKRFGKVAIDIISFVTLAVIIITILGIPFSSVLQKLGKEGADKMFYFVLSETLMLIGIFLSAWIVWHFRGVSLAGLGRSLAIRKKDLLSGISLAIVLYAVGFGVSLLAGAIEIAGVVFNPSSLLISFVFFLLVAITEEFALRGFVLERMLQGGVNKFWALFLSATLFSLVHIANPNFDFLSFINILLAGILLGSSYIYTRNLCFPIALHWFWNWIQGPVLGYEVSGNKFCDGLLTLYLPEANLINGGAFGFEGSILCTVLMVAGTAVILKMFRKN